MSVLGDGVQNKSDTTPILMGLPGSREGAERNELLPGRMIRRISPFTCMYGTGLTHLLSLT